MDSGGNNRLRAEDRDKRLGILAALAVLLILVLAARMYDMQVVLGPQLRSIGRADRVRIMPVAAQRGTITDRNGQVLAGNRPAYAVFYFNLGSRPTVEELAILARDVGVSAATMQKEIKGFQGAPYKPIQLASQLTPAQVSAVNEDLPYLPGVFVQPEPLRYDPLGKVGAQVVGHVGPITQSELAQWKSDSRLSGQSIVGQSGLELQYQSFLQGTNGGKQVEVNALNRPVKVLGDVAPVQGDTVQTTLDKTLEVQLYNDLKAQMLQLKDTYGNKAPAFAGTAVILDVHTGHVLAMVSLPSFDPNAFAGGISPSAYQALLKTPHSPLLNRSVQSQLPPGSTYKMAMAFGALMSHKITLQTVIPGKPRYWYPPFPKNWIAVNTGPNNVVKAIGQSDDVFFYDVGRRMGVDLMHYWAGQFGFGKKTGIDLPSEDAGIIPNKAYYVKRNGSFYPGLNYSLAIGQGADEVTVLQLARYIGAVATDGKVYRPELVTRIVGPKGNTVKSIAPDLLWTISGPTKYWDALHQGMRWAVRPGSIPGSGGTAGAQWANFPMKVAGKTGTAQLPGGYTASYFVSYAPYTNPQIAAVVLIEGGGEGALTAPVLRAAYDQYFHLKDPNPPFPLASMASAP